MADGRGDDISLTKMKVPRFKWGIPRWRLVTCFPHVMTKKNLPRYISRSVLAAGRAPGLNRHLVLAGNQPLFLEILQGSSPSYFGG
jgi:hypothetical protein